MHHLLEIISKGIHKGNCGISAKYRFVSLGGKKGAVRGDFQIKNKFSIRKELGDMP